MDTAKVIRKSFKFRIYPTKSQVAKLDETLSFCRELYNAGLQERRDAWNLNRISVSCFEQINQLPEIKTIREDLNCVHSQVLCNVLNRLDLAFKGFFSRVKKNQKAGFPRFKGKESFNSFTFPQMRYTVRLENNKLHLSKIGKIKIKLSRLVVGKVKTCTIKRETGKWFAIFSVETFAETLPKTGKQIGIDVGIENFATLSDGTKVENFRFFENSQKRLRVAQRTVSRRKKFSNRWRKAKNQVAKIHRKISNQRNDFQHKLSTSLVKEYDLIAIEKLNVKGLSKSFLSKQVNDVAWSGFFLKLKYKAENAGKSVIEVNPNWTSQDCSACGDRIKKDLSERTHHCLKCGLVLDRDENAAINILRLGQAAAMPSSERVSHKDVTYQAAESVSLESPSITVSV
jgi:putative transposase